MFHHRDDKLLLNRIHDEDVRMCLEHVLDAICASSISSLVLRNTACVNAASHLRDAFRKLFTCIRDNPCKNRGKHAHVMQCRSRLTELAKVSDFKMRLLPVIAYLGFAFPNQYHPCILICFARCAAQSVAFLYQR